MKRIRIFLLLALGLAIMDSCDDNPCTSEKPCIKTDTIYLKDSVTDTLLVYDTLDVFDTTTINDTLMVLDTMFVNTQTLDSEVCDLFLRMFDGVKYDTIHKAELLGKWEVIAIFDTSTCEVEIRPEKFPDSNFIVFYENDSISGRTVNNTLYGTYSLVGNRIDLSDVWMTLITEPEWGSIFNVGYYHPIHFTIFGEKLILNSQRVMVFEKRQL